MIDRYSRPEMQALWTEDARYTTWLRVELAVCEVDLRVGGRYRLVFGHGDSKMEFFGRYLEVTPHSRLVWTNEEGAEGGAVTTVTFEEKDGKTLLVMHDLYPSKEALDESFIGMEAGMPESLDQLDELVVTLGAEPTGVRRWG